MASIASPRAIPASGASTPTISSRRTSLDTTRTISPARSSTAQPSGPQARRNRVALRDYYNLKPPAEQQSSALPSSSASIASEDASLTTAESQLDQPDFDAGAYVQGLLEKDGLREVLRTESALLNEIRELDGERKALVYDNYSKLIAATDTIKGMRKNMAPLDASTGDLKTMVERIAVTASELSENAAGQKGMVRDEAEREMSQEQDKIGRQRATVRWVIGAPARFKKLAGNDDLDSAKKQWARVSDLLDKWNGVEGVEDVRSKCLEALRHEASDIHIN